MHQALYRKWRPLVFSDVAGQPHITETLRRQVGTDRLSHAYLFTGTRGTGKTTCAKILARAVNCESPEDGNPCNRCQTCLGILEGSIPDIAEIDAASNSGVDNIRSLREESVYTPVAAKKRVYIIDEVHMLSTGAFNALLKTLEEPPAHVMFILATTETHKVPATILSRCQRFAFRRIQPQEITDRLMHVASEEKLELHEGAARLLARLADGALRDALSLLDQCASQSSGWPIDTALVNEIVGLAGRERVASLAGNIANEDLPAALAELDGLCGAGKELSAVLDELSVVLRDVLLSHMLPAKKDYEDDIVAALKPLWPKDKLISAIMSLQQAQTRLPSSFNKRLEAELCIIKLCSQAPQTDSTTAPKSAPSAVIKTAPAQSAQTPLTTPPPVAAAVPVPEPQQSEPEPETEPSPAPTLEAGLRPAGDRFRRLLGLNEFFKSLIEHEKAEELGDKLFITIKDPFSMQMLKQEEFTALVKTLYPGGVDILTEKPPAEAKKRLSDFKAKAGGLVIEEK